MEDQGKVKPSELKALLMMVYKADPAILRSYRQNKNKSDQKILSRMKLLIGDAEEDATKNDAAQKETKVPIEEGYMVF